MMPPRKSKTLGRQAVMTNNGLEQRLLQAHSDNDQVALIALYTEAGTRKEADGETDAACFYLTQAYVYALELDAPSLAKLHTRLASYGRVHPL